MMLFGLLLIPLGIGVVGFVKGKGLITLKEFLAQEGVMLVLIAAGYGAGLAGQTHDVEIWNGVIASKTKDSAQCCHSYSCDCVTKCDSKGENCHEECDTCYRHGSRSTGWGGDMEWDAHSSNGEHVYHNGCNSPGTSTPARWAAIVIGEPTAIEHSYKNYIKGNPDTVLRRIGTNERFKAGIPSYPEVYDHYRARRFLTVGVNIPGADALNARLSEINAHLGSPKQVNVAVIVTKEGDQMYLEALNEAWLGGKKNDLVVVIGTPDYPRIAWTGVMSWTRNELVKINIRNRVNELQTFDGAKALDIVADEVQRNFERRPMADFEYLASTIEPPEWALWTILILGIFASLWLTYYFWHNDPFNEGYGGRNAFRQRWR